MHEVQRGAYPIKLSALRATDVTDPREVDKVHTNAPPCRRKLDETRYGLWHPLDRLAYLVALLGVLAKVGICPRADGSHEKALALLMARALCAAWLLDGQKRGGRGFFAGMPP